MARLPSKPPPHCPNKYESHSRELIELPMSQVHGLEKLRAWGLGPRGHGVRIGQTSRTAWLLG